MSASRRLGAKVTVMDRVYRPFPRMIQEADHGTDRATSSETGKRIVAARQTGTCGAGGAVYGLGLIGALVFFWQQADAFWIYVLAVLKALVWPAFLVYEAFAALLG